MDCHKFNANLAKLQAETLAQLKSRRALQDGSALKSPAAEPDSLSLIPDPQGGGRELTRLSCPQSYMGAQKELHRDRDTEKYIKSVLGRWLGTDCS